MLFFKKKSPEGTAGNPPLRIGIIGAGRGGSALLDAFRDIEQAVIVAVCDIDPAAHGIEKARRHSIPVFSDLDDMIREAPMDWLINAADTSITRRYILTRELENIVVIDGQIAELGWRILLSLYDLIVDPKKGRSAMKKQLKMMRSITWAVIQELGKAAGPMQNEIMNIAYYDPLTGLYSRRILLEFIDREIRHFLRVGMPFSLVMLDLDNFKSVNDRFGHAEGDAVLKKLALILQSSLRANDLVGRYGGEEFIIIFHNTETGTSMKLAEEIRLKIEKDLRDTEGTSITASLGITGIEPLPAHITGKDETLTIREGLLLSADKALYRAKAMGKNRVYIEK